MYHSIGVNKKLTDREHYLEWYVNVNFEMCSYDSSCRYQIIVHEIAHHETPFHDERHELLASALSSRFLPSFYKVYMSTPSAQ